jgi:glycosyltransferase involved in cell wall biosynthesis
VLPEALDRLDAYLSSLRPEYDCELVVVDDGSSDDTPAILNRWAAAHPGRLGVVTHPANAGLVAAIRSGCAAARGSVLVVMDADLSYAPETIGTLLEALQRNNALVAIASPYMRGGRTGNVPPLRLAASRIANAILSACVFGRVKTLTGMVRAYDAATLRSILAEPEQGEFNSWVLARLLASGARFVEVPAALVWPRSRTREPSRLTWPKFLSRVGLTLVTAATLLRLSGFQRRPAP